MKHNCKYSKEVLEEAVKKSISIAGVTRELGIKWNGSTHAYIRRRIDSFGIDRSHFLGQACNKGGTTVTKKTWEQVLIKTKTGRREAAFRLKRALIESGVKYQCVECEVIDVYNNKPISLHIDHIDGDWSNNTKGNLRFLCPNCHSQTPNFGNKNIQSSD